MPPMSGDTSAARWLAELLAQRGDLDEPRARADAGDGSAASELAGLLTLGDQGLGEVEVVNRG